MTVQLRPYQERAIAQLRAAYAAGRRAPCLVLPTGAGKTRVAAAVIAAAVQRSKRILFAAHRTELIDQTVEKLAEAEVTDVRIIQADRNLGEASSPVTVASIQTLTTDRWLGQLPTADLIILDECHHVSCDSWGRVVTAYPDALMMGLTATPQRGDGQPLDTFDAMIVGATVRELMDLGHLVRCRVWGGPPDLKRGQLALDPVAAYQQHGGDRLAIVFAATVRHAHELVTSFRAAGIPSDVVIGTGSREARRSSLDRFARGETRVLVNVAVLTEGYDCPAAAVCILARRFAHAGAFLQAAGRVLRPAEGKSEALLIDLAGSVHEHGTPDIDREYTLDGSGIAKAVRMAFRQCPACGSVFRLAAMCPHCSAVLPVMPTRSPRSADIGVTELGSIRPPRPAFTVALLAKREGHCGRCKHWFAKGTPIYWARGERARHQRCPVVVQPSTETTA